MLDSWLNGKKLSSGLEQTLTNLGAWFVYGLRPILELFGSIHESF